MWGTLLDQSLAYQRQIPSPDTGGGSTRTWKAMVAAFPASVQAARSSTVFRFGQRGITVDYEIYTTFDLNASLSGGIRTGDRIPAALGGYYLVQGYQRDQNAVLSLEPIYCIACQYLVE